MERMMEREGGRHEVVVEVEEEEEERVQSWAAKMLEREWGEGRRDSTTTNTLPRLQDIRPRRSGGHGGGWSDDDKWLLL